MSSSSTSIIFRDAISPSKQRVSAFSAAVRALFHTESHFAPTVARITLGISILPHGAQKLFGWFGGYGFTGTMNWFTDTLHIPWIFGFAAILAEVVGGFALLAGFASRIAAATIGTVFVTAAALVHWQHGFFVNWFGNQKGEGVEYFILGLALSVIVIWYGGGSFSFDRVLTRNPATRIS